MTTESMTVMTVNDDDDDDDEWMTESVRLIVQEREKMSLLYYTYATDDN